MSDMNNSAIHMSDMYSYNLQPLKWGKFITFSHYSVMTFLVYFTEDYPELTHFRCNQLPIHYTSISEESDFNFRYIRLLID